MLNPLLASAGITPAHISVVLIVVVMLLYMTELIPLAVTALGACACLVLLGVAPGAVAWSGFSNDSTLMIAGMIVVGLAIFETGLATEIGNLLIRRSRNSPRLAVVGILIVTMVVSAFVNNTTATATFMPVLIGIVLSSKGAIHEKTYLLPLAVASSTGGMLTLIGSTPQVLVNGLLAEEALPVFGFFEFAKIGLPLCVVYLIYVFTYGQYASKKRWGNCQTHSPVVQLMEHSASTAQDKGARTHGARAWIAIVILVGTVVCMGFANTAKITLGTIAMIAAGLCVLTGCVSIKTVYEKMDWSTMFILAGSIGFAAGVDRCGGGKLIADFFVARLGGSPSPYTVLAILTVLSCALSQLMSNTACVAMMAPIGLALSEMLMINPLPIAMGICMGCSCSFSTPVATPSLTLVLGAGGYKFADYSYYSALYNVIAVALVVFLVPIFWAF